MFNRCVEPPQNSFRLVRGHLDRVCLDRSGTRASDWAATSGSEDQSGGAPYRHCAARNVMFHLQPPLVRGTATEGCFRVPRVLRFPSNLVKGCPIDLSGHLSLSVKLGWRGPARATVLPRRARVELVYSVFLLARHSPSPPSPLSCWPTAC